MAWSSRCETCWPGEALNAFARRDAIDAGAAHIDVTMDAGGRTAITVTDDSHGDKTSGLQVAKEGFDFDDGVLEPLADFSEAPPEHNSEMAGRRGDAVDIGMVLTFQIFVGVGWSVWG